jgi:hypothetical protein
MLDSIYQDEINEEEDIFPHIYPKDIYHSGLVAARCRPLLPLRIMFLISTS